MKCPNCGASATGKFCSSCGGRLGAASCTACGAAQTAGARFCHVCGAAAGAGPAVTAPANQVPWIVAGVAVVALLAVLAVVLLKPWAASPEAAATAPARPGPVDLTQISPRDAADRLFNRVMDANERGINDTATFFAPMALNAYAMLGGLDADARYHVGLLSLVTADHATVLAQADSLAQSVPGHLYASVLRAEVARAQNDQAALRRAEAAFMEHYDAEIAAQRSEYADHPGLLDRFRQEVVAARERGG